MFLFRHWCAIHNSEEMVKIAVQHLQESVGEYELWVAVWYIRYEAQALSILSFLRVGDIMRVVRFLDCPSEDEEGETALMLAAKRKNRSFSKLLLYTQNQLICMYVCIYVCFGIFSLFCHLLLSFGADPNVRSARGRTASMIANSLGWNRLSGL